MNRPLVSVCVITYNSSTYITETLNSIKNQTYANIELVISDDFSTDNTVAICSDWILNNKARFANVKLITSDINTGTSLNLNRGLKGSSGEWIKIMAGDDLLFDYSIMRFIQFIEKNNENVCVSKLEFFGNAQRVEQKKQSYNLFYDKYSILSKHGKYTLLLKECLLPMPGLFISKKTLEEINYIDENYPFAEEWPTYLNILEKGIDIPYIDEMLVRYRCAEDSLSSIIKNKTDKSISYSPARNRVYLDSFRYFNDYRKRRLIKNKMYVQVWNQVLNYKMAKIRLKPNLGKFDKLKMFFLRSISTETYNKAIQYIVSGQIKYLTNRLIFSNKN
ncbi:glycosyltransferase family 2 protein [Perlabentimonas gracilis]|uniref:glycosyltransferase family 2 protein n=1 Tax=Perlabentimonas gracilis TaxID=2715279 RepID=UPI0021D21126|nr:glycosyltransferase family 2 protein [Perlabentimonas gracilis]